MIKIFCDFCEQEVPRDVYPFEKRWNRHFCNKECRVAYDKATGHFKRMSDLGKAGRSRVIPQSNRDKPRRRKQTILHL
jgi:hypothetical protein